MTGPGRQMLAADIRAMIRARRLRERYFDAQLFADPVWDILLDLAAAQLEGRSVSVSSACIAASVPPTTALRHIDTLEQRCVIVRERHPTDRRFSLLSLSGAAMDSLIAYLAASESSARPTAHQQHQQQLDAALADIRRAADRIEGLVR